MRRLLSLTWVILPALMLGAGGCKMVQTTFVNTTGEAVDLQVNGPGLNINYVGVIPPNGQIRTKIEVSPVWLPNTYTWTAGEHSGAFTLAKDTPAKIWVHIPMSVTAGDPGWRHAEGHEQTGDPTPIVYEE